MQSKIQRQFKNVMRLIKTPKKNIFSLQINQIQVEKYDIKGVKCEKITFEQSLPDLRPDQFLVKIKAIPIHPFDLQKISGTIQGLTLPFVPGSEAYGEIIYAHQSDYVGKYVSIWGNGNMWQDYQIGSINNSIVWDQDKLEYACGLINPITALGLLSIAKDSYQSGIVNIAANSSVGKQIHKVAKKYNFSVINLVRNQQTLKTLKDELQCDYILNYQDENFIQEFQQLALKLESRIAYDPVGGKLAGKIFNALPRESCVINYGSLSQQDISGISMAQVRWSNKMLKGFVSFEWWGSLNVDQQKQTIKFIKENFEELFQTQIIKTYAFKDVQIALKDYKEHMSNGKILLLTDN